MRRVNGKLAVWAALMSLGIASSAVPAAAQKTATTATAATAARPLPLPISILDVMRASIEIPANGIWAAEAADALSEEDWQLADQDAVNLIAATTLLGGGGTGKNDAKWTANADWQSWVRDMEKTALQIRSAAKATDQKRLAAAGDHLQEICEACHSKYRPQAPSDGVSRYPFYPKRELAK
jgi:cytochrome c'